MRLDRASRSCSRDWYFPLDTHPVETAKAVPRSNIPAAIAGRVVQGDGLRGLSILSSSSMS